ncbi:MAG: hypothetical protein ACRDZ7_05795 [Acidimicrobiia bacterium]
MAAHRRSLDPGTVDGLVAGRVGPDDAPPGYRGVAGMLQAAASSSGDSASIDDADPVGSLAAAIREELATPASPPARRHPVLKKLLVGKGIVALATLTLSASAVGAATGNLPDSVQDKVAKVVAHAGVNIPHSNHGVERVTDDSCVPAADDGSFARNRGQYLQQQRAESREAFEAAKETRCGMPVQSGADEAGEAPEAPESPDVEGSDHSRSGEDHGAPADNPAGVTTPKSDKANPAADAGPANSGKANPAGDDHPTGNDHPTGDDNPGGRR